MKNIAVLMPKFYDYSDILKDELKKYYDNVFIFYNQNKKNIIKKILLNKIKKILIIKVEDISEEFLIEMKKNKIEMILYEWDDLKKYKTTVEKIKYFDRAYSYNLDDERKDLKYIPIFAKLLIDKDNLKNKDIYFIGSYGSIHKDRLKIIKEFEKKLSHSYILDFRLYNSIQKILYNLIINKVMIKDLKYFTFFKVKYLDMLKNIKKSNCILDLKGEGQIGLTTRIMEALLNETKIITNNKKIIKYKFYDEENIFIFENIENIDIEKLNTFIKKPFSKEKSHEIEKFKIENWLKELQLI